MLQTDLVERLRRIAEALDLPLSALLDDPASIGGVGADELERLIAAFVQISRAEDRAKVFDLASKLASDSRH